MRTKTVARYMTCEERQPLQAFKPKPQLPKPPIKRRPPPAFTSSEVLPSLDDAIDEAEHLVAGLKALRTNVKKKVNAFEESPAPEGEEHEGAEKEQDKEIMQRTLRDMKRLMGTLKEEFDLVEARLKQRAGSVFPKRFKSLQLVVPELVNRDAQNENGEGEVQSAPGAPEPSGLSMGDKHERPQMHKPSTFARSGLMPFLDDSVKEAQQLVNGLTGLQTSVDERVTELDNEDSSEEDEDEDDEHCDPGSKVAVKAVVEEEKYQKLIERTMRDVKRLVGTFNEEIQLAEPRGPLPPANSTSNWPCGSRTSNNVGESK